MRPVDVEAIAQDDYQDARVLDETEEYVELEVVHYPLNTVAEAIRGDPAWVEAAERMREFLEPGITTNWDDGMRRDLRRDLAAEGIDVDGLDDVELVTRVARWSLDRARSLDVFTTYHAWFPDGRPAMYPGLEAKFERAMDAQGWTFQELLEREHLGRGMYYNRTRGTCTSSATYLATVMRAVASRRASSCASPPSTARTRPTWSWSAACGTTACARRWPTASAGSATPSPRTPSTRSSSGAAGTG